MIAAAVSFLVGFLVLGALTLARGGVPSMATRGLRRAVVGVGRRGALGAVYVWAAASSVGTLGVVTLVAALVFGQLAAALVLDANGCLRDGSEGGQLDANCRGRHWLLQGSSCPGFDPRHPKI
jgi:uncharacterized membrane protein YdcZ (DUF606 family)